MENRVRKFAKEARARLLKNNYDKPQKKVPSGRVFKIANDPKEQLLYEKVCEIAQNQAIVTNPLGRLIDQTLYSSMSETEKLKYVFNLSNKYIHMLERFRNTNAQELQYAHVIYD